MPPVSKLLFLPLILNSCIQSQSVELEQIDMAVSPYDKKIAYVMDVGTGATNGFVTWILVSEKGIKLDPQKDRIAVIEGQVARADWLSETEIVMFGDDLKLFSVDEKFIITLQRE